jgi:hypothetical protein
MYEFTLCHIFLLQPSLSDSGAVQVKPNGGNDKRKQAKAHVEELFLSPF